MQRVIALIGPTAVGKSAVAVELAQSLGAEIVSCDSMQVYRQMAVLSQAPTHGQRAQVQHHLIEFIDPTESFSVGQYRKLAASVIDRILARGKRVLIVGGTRLPCERIRSMMGAAIRRYSPTLKPWLGSVQETRWCWTCARWAWVGAWVRTLISW